MKAHSIYVFILFIFSVLSYHGQNETAKWYFGYGAAMDFMTTPPTQLAASSMTVDEGCASISDDNGALLFYTDGLSIWTKTHTVMANGTGLLGGHSSTQSSIILKKPGSSSMYYVFTVQGNTWAPGLHYSVVDMSLASGQGSVTAKNVNVYPGRLYEKITATRHCNGSDFWIVVRDFSSDDPNNSGNFHSFQFGSAGTSTTDVTSVFTYTNNFHVIGAMKISPNGKKLACANYNYVLSDMTFELFDFDNSTGVVTNSLALVSSFVNNVNSFFASGYGVEFSPDCTKLYGSLGNFYATTNNGNILEWDLCSGSNSVIANSQTTISAATGTNYFGVGSLQLAKDGKIYVAHSSLNNGVEALSVINNPNAYGAASNFSYGVIAVNSYSPHWGLPNYGSYNFLKHPTPPPFASSSNTNVGCFGMAFSAPSIQNSVTSCAASAYSVTSYAWDFGDPLSGTTNTSFLANPSHNFSAPGNYTTQLIIYYTCGGGTDTLRQPISVLGTNSISLNVNTASITCASLGTGTAALNNGIGLYTYSWTPTNQTTSIATGLIPGTYTITVRDDGLNCSLTNTVYFAPLIPLTANVVFSPSITCYGASTGTAAFINLAGGSPNQYYTWFNGANTYTTSTVTGLSAGVWNATVTDALTACQVNSVISITQPPVFNLNIGSTSAGTCVGSQVSLTGTCSGGTPGYNYVWSNGANINTTTVNQTTPGVYVYTLTVHDTYNCAINNTVAVQFDAVPFISVSNSSICAGDSLVILPAGATNYIISGGSATVSPLVTTAYSVTGTSLGGCAASNTAVCAVFVNPLPTITVNSGSVCFGSTFTLVPSGATTYTFSGGTAIISPSVSTSYSVTGSSTDGCKSNLAVASITVIALPQVTVTSSNKIICAGETVTLTASGASSYVWGTLANIPSIVVSPGASNQYVATGTDNNGCANSFTFSQNVSPCTGSTSDYELASLGVKVYPNPSTGFFTISTDKTAEIALVNMLGQIIQTHSATESNNFRVSISELTVGVYFIIGSAGNLPIKQKIIVSE